MSENAHNNREAFYLLERGTRWLGHYQILNVKNALDRGKLAKNGKITLYQDYEMFSINWIQHMLLVLHNLSDFKEDFF